MHLQQLLDVARWFDPFPKPPSPVYLVAVVVFVLWTIASIVIYHYRRKIFASNGALIGMATRFGPYAIAIGVTGLFLLAMRYASFPYLSMPFLFYLTILTAIGYLLFLAYYLKWRYPSRVAEVRAAEIRRRYSSDRKKKKRRR